MTLTLVLLEKKLSSVYLKNADNVGGMAAIEALAKQ